MQPGETQGPPDSIDRPVTIYVAGTAGGGIDLYARLVGRHLGRHIPGKPTVTVQVMPGAGGIRAANFLAEQAPRDGTAIATFAGGPILEPLIGARKTGYEMNRFTMVGAVTKDIGLCMAWGATPFRTIEDARKQQMVVAGTGAGSETDTWPLVLNDVLGTRFKLVTGYLGSQETILAIERGEAHGRCVFSYSALKIAKPDWLRDNRINVLLLTALERSPDFPGRAGGGGPRLHGRGSPAARAHGRSRRDGTAVRGPAGPAGEQGHAAAARLRCHHAGSRVPRRGGTHPGRPGANERRAGTRAGRPHLCHAAAGDRAGQEAARSVTHEGAIEPNGVDLANAASSAAQNVGKGRRTGPLAPLHDPLGLAHPLQLGSCGAQFPVDGAGVRPGRTMSVAFDEMRGSDGTLRPAYSELSRWLTEVPPDVLDYRRREAEVIFRRIGITFAVYGEADAQERLIPFDVLPRILAAAEWDVLRAGLEQRIKAINHYIRDIYSRREILRAGIVPEDLVFQNPVFRPEMNGQKVPHDIYVHIGGIDIVRVDAETFYVLEDNARTPSGVSYMLENREIMLRLFPELFARHRVAPVENYPDELLATLDSIAPATASADPIVVLLTPGVYNSAYYEHSFLADKLGVELVEGRDLFVKDDFVFMRTTQGPKRVDVIYRRIDDDFLDPLAFRPDSALGVPGLMSAYQAGNVTLANAVGTGIADDKAVYSYMPEILKFYLGEEPILKNVPTWRCREQEHLAYVLDHLEELVIKEVHGSGGYGMLIGPKADKATIAAFRAKLKATPKNFVAQPTLALSTCPTCVEEGVAPRHVDLRPFVLTGRDRIRIVPGGLTRVALRKGSLVVNSSQGGGTKDTWVLDR